MCVCVFLFLCVPICVCVCVCACSILLKVCVLLRNRYEEVREVVRGTLVKMIQTLGPRYLLYLLTEMQSVLNRGYQVTHTHTHRSTHRHTHRHTGAHTDTHTQAHT